MRPLALVGFCGAGGIDVGLEMAGFDTIALDWMPSSRPRETWPTDRRTGRPKQPNDATQHYCGSGEAHMVDLSTADAVEAVIRAFKPDLAVFSPPCQRFSSATPTKNRADHPDLIGSTREGMLRAGVPGWIENVATDKVPLTGHWVMLCGVMFGLMKLKRHRRFELIGWRIPQPFHDSRLCLYGRRDTAGPLFGDEDGEATRRVAVAVAGHGPPDAAQSREYAERRAVESVHEGSHARESRERRDVTSVHGGSMGTNQRKAREVIVVCSNAASGRGLHRGGQWATKGKEIAKAKRREVMHVTGTGGVSLEAHDVETAKWTHRRLVTVSGDNGSNPGGVAGTSGQNRPGPECVRWREALGWIDGPRNRYALAQCIPPAYAEFLGRAFLSTLDRRVSS